MDNLDKEMVKEALGEILDERNRVDSVTHQKHHDFVAALIHKEETKERRYEKVKAQVMGWGLIIFLGGVGAAVYTWFTQFVALISKNSGG